MVNLRICAKRARVLEVQVDAGIASLFAQPRWSRSQHHHNSETWPAVSEHDEKPDYRPVRRIELTRCQNQFRATASGRQ